MKWIWVLICVVGIGFCAQVEGGAMSFGKQDLVHKIQDVNFLGPEGQQLYLGYRTTSLHFIAGVYLIEQGYVLGIKNNKEVYYPLSPKEIAELQASKDLPTPLPEYHLSFWDYFFGYSLWFIIPTTFLYAFLKDGFDKWRASKGSARTKA